MLSVKNQPLRSLGLAMLIGGLLAASLTGCAARRLRASETATAGAAGQPTAASSDPGTGAVSATPATSPSDQIDSELEKLDSELNSADTLSDFSTALPPDEATPIPAAGAPTSTPAPNEPTVGPPPTTAPSGDDQGAQIDQLLAALQGQLSKTDTVPEAANP